MAAQHLAGGHLIPYLTFNGNCRQAMAFYQECLGGTLKFQSVSEAPLGKDLPLPMKNCILHAVLKSDHLQLAATDITVENGIQQGNSVSLFLKCASAAQANSVYRKLSHSGTQTQPIATTAHKGLCGNLTDQFGHHWLIHFDPFTL